jgi:hypothetical protein
VFVSVQVGGRHVPACGGEEPVFGKGSGDPSSTPPSILSN